MSKMGSHDPFGHLMHKLWPKEGPGVKLVIWLPTIKSQRSTQFPCVKMACNILLEISRWELQLCFKPHLNRRFARKVMGPKVVRVPAMRILKVSGQNVIWMWASWKGIEYTIKGKVVASPKSGLWWVLWVRICLWLFLAPKCSNYALTNLLFGLCRLVWVSKLLVNLPSPIPELQHAPLPHPKVLRAKECAPTPYSSVVFVLYSHLSL